MQNTQAPAFYRFKLGNFEATVVSDGPLAIGPAARAFSGPSEAELGNMFAEHFLPTDNVVLEQNSLVINTGDRLILFDTGMSSVKRPNAQYGRLVASLKQAGMDAKDIDAIVLTHPHIDHSRRHGGGRRQPHLPQCASLHDAGRFRLLDGSEAHRNPGGRFRPDRPAKPAALSRPHDLHQGRPGIPAGLPGHADARTYASGIPSS